MFRFHRSAGIGLKVESLSAINSCVNPSHPPRVGSDSQRSDVGNTVTWRHRLLRANGLTVATLLSALLLLVSFLPPIWRNSRLWWTFALSEIGFVLWGIIVLCRAGLRAGALKCEYVPIKSHYIQALVQIFVYAYCGWYWRRLFSCSYG